MKYYSELFLLFYYSIIVKDWIFYILYFYKTKQKKVDDIVFFLALDLSAI